MYHVLSKEPASVDKAPKEQLDPEEELEQEMDRLRLEGAVDDVEDDVTQEEEEMLRD